MSTGNPHNPEFSAAAEERLSWLLSRYPTKQAALLPALHLAQEEFGWVSNEVIDYVAKKLELAAIDVQEVATFYTMYHKKPAGKHCVYVCTNIGCFLNGADDLLAYLEKKFGVKAGETTPDGRYSLFSVECLANCGEAPAAQINDDYHDRVTPDSVNKVLESLP
jgi:NADH-quinone oxidoreductase subunit E